MQHISDVLCTILIILINIYSGVWNYYSQNWNTDTVTSTKTNKQTYKLQIKGFLASLGVDAVVGHHPHVLQPHAIIGNTTVIYSCGNYLFDSHVCRDRETNALTPGGVVESPGCMRMQVGRRRMTALATRRSRHYRLHVTAKGLVRAEYMPILLDDDHIPAPWPEVPDSVSGPVPRGDEGDAAGAMAVAASAEQAGSSLWQQVCGPDDLHCLSCE